MIVRPAAFKSKKREAKVQISHHEVSLAEGVINEKDTLIFVLDSLEKTAKQGRKSKSGKKKEDTRR